jgi:predicted permease
MSSFVQDFRYAIRVLLKSRGTTLIAVVALALGIGANTAIFSIVNAVLFRPLPYHQPDRLMTVLTPGSSPVAPADYLDTRAQAQSFERMGAAEFWGGSLTGRESPEQILGLHLSEDMFALLGVAPLRGRTFDKSDFTPGKEHVLVISHALWQRSFGGLNDAIGQQVLLDGTGYTVIGVMPPDFYFAPFWATRAEMWAPLDLSARLHARNGQSLRVFGRLKPGATPKSAQAEVDQICHNLAVAYPEDDTGFRMVVESLTEQAVGRVRLALQVLLGAVGMVLLIACANVANLALVRATARQKEISVRRALGAPRWRIARQFLVESVVLALTGGAAGLFLAEWGTQVLKATLTSHLTRSNTIAIDTQVLLFTLGLALITGLLFGIAPAFSAARGDVNDGLKEGGRGSTSGGSGGRVRRTLVASEIAVALVLLIGAGLLMRSFVKLRAINPGFDAHNVLTMTISLTGRPEYTGANREALYRSILAQVEAVPGVREASMTNHLPIAGDLWTRTRTVEGRPLPARGQELGAVYRVSRPNYFSTMGVRFAAGRDFTDRDNGSAPQVAIVNETLARREFKNGADAVGKRITVGDPQKNPEWRTIVGVVKDLKQGGWSEVPRDELYIPFTQETNFFASTAGHYSSMTLVVRTNLDAASLARPVKNAIWSLDRNLPLSHTETLETAIGDATWQSRFSVLLIGIFSGLALVLAMIGIYGVIAYEVAERTHEIGIRMALGAGRGGIAAMIARQSLPVAILGIACGLGAAAALARLMRGMLYEIDPADPATFAGVAVLVLLVATLAALVPARRATRVDPMIALRHE